MRMIPADFRDYFLPYLRLIRHFWHHDSAWPLQDGMIFVLTAAAVSASGNISSTRCVIMLQSCCNSLSPDIARLQPACKNFSPASTPCLLDSALPPPWHCPAAVCPQRVFSEQQASLVWQDKVFIWQEKAADEQHGAFAKQQLSFVWQQRVIVKQNPSAAG